MKLRRKLRDRAGLTLVELMAAVVILGLIGTAIGVGIPAALRAYRQVTAAGEASVLCTTLTTAISDELRFARNIQGDGTFDSVNYGVGARIETDDGKVKIKGSPLIGGSAYTSGLKAEVDVGYADGSYTVQLQIYSGGDLSSRQVWEDQTFTVRPLNGGD